MRLAHLLSCAAIGASLGCSDGTAVVGREIPVVQAFLYAHEPVTDVRVTTTYDIGGDSTQSRPVSDAQVVLVRRGIVYPLVPSDSAGYYHYAGTDLDVAEGDTFDLEVRALGVTATARTVVPPRPASLALSSSTIIAPTPGAPGGTPPSFDSLRIVVRWTRVDGAYHYAVVESIDPDAAAIERPFAIRRFTSPPTRADSLFVDARGLNYYGVHRLVLYRVNDEYAALYETRQQDTRDLNEPRTNIIGALGIFSAFSGDSASFTVK
jgi:hypothetical protein